MTRFAERSLFFFSTHESDSRRGYHAPLTHCEASDDGEGQYGEDDWSRQDVVEVSGERLAEVAFKHGCDVDDRIRHDELKEPAEQTSGC